MRSLLRLMQSGGGRLCYRYRFVCSKTTMQAMVLDAPGPASQLQLTTRPIPSLDSSPSGSGTAARVRVLSCAVAFRDIIDRNGGFPFMQQPTILGHEFSGIVEEVGEEVDSSILAPGDHVVSLHWAQQLSWPAPFDSKKAMSTFLGLGCDGGYAEYCTTHHSAFVKIPEECHSWTPNEAASIVSTFGTVWQGAVKTAGLSQDVELNSATPCRVLVTGAGGGVGSAAVQLLSALNHNVIAVTSNPSKISYVKSLYKSQVGVAGGVDVVDASRTKSFSKQVLKAGGAVDMVLIGNVTNSTFELPLGLCIVKSLAVIGTDSCEASAVVELMQLMQAKGLKPHIDQILDLSLAQDAHKLVETSAVKGRVVLSITGDGESWQV